MERINFNYRIAFLSTELQKQTWSIEDRAQLEILLMQYQGGATAEISSHTARMLNPELARQTSEDYLKSLESLFFTLFPVEG